MTAVLGALCARCAVDRAGRLAGSGDIAKRLRMSRQRVQQIAAEPDFPEPLQTLAMGRVWLESDVEAWLRGHRPDLASRWNAS